MKALGVTDYEVMFQLTDFLLENRAVDAIKVVELIHADGKDLKQFMHLYTNFLLDINKYYVGCPFELMQIPKLDDYVKWLKGTTDEEFENCLRFLNKCVILNSDIKYSQYVKADIEAFIILLCEEDKL